MEVFKTEGVEGFVEIIAQREFLKPQIFGVNAFKDPEVLRQIQLENLLTPPIYVRSKSKLYEFSKTSGNLLTNRVLDF
jgi:hypothetical protein